MVSDILVAFNEVLPSLPRGFHQFLVFHYSTRVSCMSCSLAFSDDHSQLVSPSMCSVDANLINWSLRWVFAAAWSPCCGGVSLFPGTTRTYCSNSLDPQDPSKRNLHTISRKLGQNELHTCDTSDESNFSQPKARKIKKAPKQLCTVNKWRKPDYRSETVRRSVYRSTAEPHAWKLASYVNQQAEARNLCSTASGIQRQHNHNQSPNIHVHNLARKLQMHKPQNNQNRELSNKLWKAT